MTEDTYREHLNDLQVEIEELRAKLAEYKSTMGQLSGAAQSTKTDTISRQAAIDALNKRARKISPLKDGYLLCLGALHDASDDIRELPSAQPEIVRCKNCKHYEEINQPYPQMFCRRHQLDTLEDDYCSYGEKA